MRVVQHGLRAVLGLDDDVRLGQPALEVAALVAARRRRASSRGAPPRPRRAAAAAPPTRTSSSSTAACARARSSAATAATAAPSNDGSALSTSEETHSGPRQPGSPGWRSWRDALRSRGVSTPRTPGAASARAASIRVTRARAYGAAEHGRLEHPRQAEVGGVARLPGRPLAAVDARRRAADHLERPLGPGVERVLLDHDPLLGVAALDLLLGLDQPCHYAAVARRRRPRGSPPRCRGRRRSGRGCPPSRGGSPRASAPGSPPGARTPRRSGPACRSRTGARRRARTRPPAGASRRPSIVVTSAPSTACSERDAREHRHVVDEHRARAAVALVAGDLRPGEAEVLAQRRRRASGRPAPRPCTRRR